MNLGGSQLSVKWPDESKSLQIQGHGFQLKRRSSSPSGS